MRKLLLSIIIATLTAGASYAQTPLRAASDGPIEISGSRKGVRTSTDITLGVMAASTLTLALVKQDWKGLALGAGECAGVFAVTYGLKYLVKKKRPDGSDNHSFPSGHTSLAFTDASFIMRRYGWKFGVPAYALAGYVAWGRCYAKKHDFWDVAAGAAIGSAVGLLCTTPFAREHDLKIAPQVIPDPAGNSFVSFGVGGSMTF